MSTETSLKDEDNVGRNGSIIGKNKRLETSAYDDLLSFKRDVQRHRADYVDALRGLLIVLAIQDHLRFFMGIGPSSAFYYGINPSYYDKYNNSLAISIIVYLFRGITHICPVGFYFLLGFSILLVYDNRVNKLKWELKEIILYYLKRGIMLTIVGCVIRIPIYAIQNAGEVIKFYPDILFNLGISMIIFGVFNAILCQYGYSFGVYMATYVLIIILCVGSTELVTPRPDSETSELDRDYSTAKIMFYIAGENDSVSIFFSLIPWLTPMCIGFICGKLFIMYRARYIDKFFKIIKYTSIICIILAILLRSLNGISRDIKVTFGNFGFNWNWNGYENISWNIFHYFVFTKYPPSICYLLLFTSFNLILILIFKRFTLDNDEFIEYGRTYNLLIIFGRVSFMIWIFQWYITFGIGSLLSFIINEIIDENNDGNIIIKLILLIPIWILIILILYYPASIYSNFKKRQKPDSIWRML